MRNRDTMRFGNVVWQIGPENLKLGRSRRLSCYSDGSKVYLHDGGEDESVISCSGCFFGEDSDEKLEELKNLFEKAEVLPLSVPGMGVTYAKLKKLHELIVAICYSIGSLGFLISWIMQIMNRCGA